MPLKKSSELSSHVISSIYPSFEGANLIVLSIKYSHGYTNIQFMHIFAYIMHIIFNLNV